MVWSFNFCMHYFVSNINMFAVNRSLEMVPIAFSLTVSFLSAVAVLGIPAEIYMFGTMYEW